MSFGSAGARQTITGGIRHSSIPPKTEGTPGPDSPLELDPKDWKASIKYMASSIQDDRITMAAAGMAYYFFLAVFPALIAAVGVVGLIEGSSIFIDSLRSSIERSMPGAAGQLLTQAIDNAQSGSKGASVVAAIVGVAIALWSATSGMVALQTGLDIAYNVPRERKLVKKRLFALMLVVATGILGALPAPLFAQKGWMWSAAGWLVTLVSITTLFALFYYLGPNRDAPNWKWVSPGGILGTLMWMAASAGFTFYVANFGKYAETYGTFAGVVVLIFWLYLSALAILIGGELNAALEHRTAKLAGRI